MFCCKESYLTLKALPEHRDPMGPELRAGHVTLGKSFTHLDHSDVMALDTKIVESLTIPLKQKIHKNRDPLIFQNKIALLSLFPGFMEE